MKKIKYNGSLTNDLDLINDRNQEPDNIGNFNLFIRTTWIILLAIIFLLALSGKLNPALISSLVSSITAITLTSSTNRHLRNSKRFKKMNAKTQLHSLLYELAKKQKDLDMEKHLDNIYRIDDIIEAVVVEHSPENTTESITTEDIEDYIREVTSDIYIINNAAKLKVLREIKNVMTITGSKRAVTGSATLYELEEDEIPRKEELPVKQVLRLRNESNEKYTL